MLLVTLVLAVYVAVTPLQEVTLAKLVVQITNNAGVKVQALALKAIQTLAKLVLVTLMEIAL